MDAVKQAKNRPKKKGQARQREAKRPRAGGGGKGGNRNREGPRTAPGRPQPPQALTRSGADVHLQNPKHITPCTLKFCLFHHYMFTFKQRWTSETLGDGRFDLGGFPLQVTACLLLRKLTISIARAGRGRHSEVLEAPDQVQRPQGCCCWLCAGPGLTGGAQRGPFPWRWLRRRFARKVRTASRSVPE